MKWMPKLLNEQLATPEIKRLLQTLIGLSIVINLLLLTSPLYMLQMYDRVLTSRSEATLWAISGIALFLLAGYGVLEIMRARTLVSVGLALDERFRENVFTSLFRESVHHSETLSAQAIRDLETLRNLLSGQTLAALFDLPWAPFFIGLIFIMHPLLGSVALGGALISLFLALLSERNTRPLVGEAGKSQMQAARFVEIGLRNADAIHANGMLANIRRRWLAHYEKSVMTGSADADQIAAFSGITKAFRITMQSVMLGCGAWLALQNEVSSGAMVAASIIFGRAIAPLDQAISASKGFISGLIALKRLESLLERHADTPTPMALPVPKGALKVEELALLPPGGRKPVLQNVNFELAPGEFLAIVGPSASGKSSLARALVGLWPPAHGRVRLDGAELRQWEADALGKHLGYLPQDVELLSGSVRENIARFAEADAADVLQAAQQAACHELVLNLPEGYDTLLGEGGVRLSGGQSQRLALARCFFGSPALVVLDEPDSNLDVDGLAALDATLSNLKTRGTTTVLITHNVRLLRHADKALLLANGTQSYFGPPRELIEKLSKRPA